MGEGLAGGHDNADVVGVEAAMHRAADRAWRLAEETAGTVMCFLARVKIGVAV